MPVTPPPQPVMPPEPGLAVACHCPDCAYPTDANRDTRLLHAEHHREFLRRYGSSPTPRELVMWTTLRTLAGLEATETRPSTGHYGACNRYECAGKPAHAEGHA